MAMLQDNSAPGADDWRKELAADNPEAWKKLLQTLLPLAMAALRERFGLTRGQGTNLIQLHRGDELAAEAALYSAWSSFRRHFEEDEFENIRDLETLAGHFIRIAYNRWQRSHRAQRKMDRAVAEGVVDDGSGQAVPRDYSDPSPGPAEQLVADEFREYLWAAVDSVKEGLSASALRDVQGHLDDLAQGVERTQGNLAQSLGVSQAAISRHLNAFFDRLRELLADSGRE